MTTMLRGPRTQSEGSLLVPQVLVARPSPPRVVGARLAGVARYGFAALVCLGLLAYFLHPNRVPLDRPAAYDWGDGKLTMVLIHGLVEHGWYLHNDALAAPFGQDLRGFPMADNLHFAIIKLLSLATPDAGLLYNLYFILTFPLTVWASLFTLRRFGVSYLPALVVSLLFAFLPYHFLRAYCGHLFLAGYYLVPPTLLVAMRIFLGQFPIVRTEPISGRSRLHLANWPTAGCVLLCALVAGGGVYYAFFACFLWLAAGIGGSLRSGRLMPALAGGAVTGLATAALLVNVAPSLAYMWQQGSANRAVNRFPIHAEIGALKIAQLLLPVTGHRVGFLRERKAYYNRANEMLVNDNDWATLGMLGSAGLLLSLAGLAWRRGDSPRSRLLFCLGFLNLAALLLATVGGFGSLFSTLISPWIRSYNRMCVYVAFLSFFALALGLDAVRIRYVHSWRGWLVYAAALLALLTGGIYDQTMKRCYASLVSGDFAADRDFVQKVEAVLPAGAAIYQLPNMSFPESLGVYCCADYEPFRGYLHSQQLRWSYGAMRGSEGDLWQARVATLPPATQLKALAAAGYDGLYIDRVAFKDNARGLEAALCTLTGSTPIASANNRLAFYDLREHNRRFRAGFSDMAWDSFRERVLHPVLFSWERGFSWCLEGAVGEDWRWCAAKGELRIINGTHRPKRVGISMQCAVAAGQPALLLIDGDILKQALVITNPSVPYSTTLTVPPGAFRLTFTCDGAKLPFDAREIVFRLANFRATDLEEEIEAATKVASSVNERR
jgi:phosphoglycerol transferase